MLRSTRTVPRLLSTRTNRRGTSLGKSPHFDFLSNLRSLSSISSTSSGLRPVKIVEVGPRDGLQNEKRLLKTELKVELIRKLVEAGFRDVESGSFVAPKWVPQMASTPEVLTSLTLNELRESHPDLSLPVLVPNSRGLDSLFQLFDANPSAATPLTNEIAVFVGCTDGFSKANLNCTVSESLDRLPSIIERAKGRGLKVRGYVSTVLGCPFDGKVEPEQPARVAKQLLDMGVYEVSLGDTIGVGVPTGWESLVNSCERFGVGADKLAAHCHDTYGTALASVLHCVQTLRIRTIDSSISALGGCPYSPNSTGNVSTEDVIYLLSTSNVPTTLLPEPIVDFNELIDRNETFAKICEIGEWISRELSQSDLSRGTGGGGGGAGAGGAGAGGLEGVGKMRENGSRVGKAWRGRRNRLELLKERGKFGAKL